MRVIIEKHERRLTVFEGGREVFRCRVALGCEPEGPKQREGDGRTPEGVYTICLVKERGKYGRSLGLSRLQSAWHIVLPQAMKNILPAIGNEMIALLKETAVAGYVAVQDLTRAGNLIRNNTYDSFNPLMLMAVVYLVLVIGMTQLLGLLERRLRRSDKR